MLSWSVRTEGNLTNITINDPSCIWKPRRVGLCLYFFNNEEAASGPDLRSLSSTCLNNPIPYCSKSRCGAESQDCHPETQGLLVSSSTGVCACMHGWGFFFAARFKRQLLVQMAFVFSNFKNPLWVFQSFIAVNLPPFFVKKAQKYTTLANRSARIARRFPSSRPFLLISLLFEELLPILFKPKQVLAADSHSSIWSVLAIETVSTYQHRCF